MFTGFLYHLRAYGLKVSMMEWLALMRALCEGYARSNLTVFYHLSRALLVKREADFDTFDRAFATFFADVSDIFDVTDAILDGEVVILDAKGISDFHALQNALGRWGTGGGGGGGDGATGTGEMASHDYVADGTYDETLTVTDDASVSDSTTQTLTLIGNQAPTASFTATPGSGVAPLTGRSSAI